MNEFAVGRQGLLAALLERERREEERGMGCKREREGEFNIAYGQWGCM